MSDDVTALASYRRTVERIRERWPTFQERRTQRLQQQGRFGDALVDQPQFIYRRACAMSRSRRATACQAR